MLNAPWTCWKKKHYQTSLYIICVCLSHLTATTPSLSAVCDFEQSLCGWSADPQSGMSWTLHTVSSSSSSTGHGTHGTRQDLALGTDGEYIKCFRDARHRLWKWKHCSQRGSQNELLVQENHYFYSNSPPKTRYEAIAQGTDEMTVTPVDSAVY